MTALPVVQHQVDLLIDELTPEKAGHLLAEKRRSLEPIGTDPETGKNIYAQVIDDTLGQTLASASSMEAEIRQRSDFENKVAVATHIGQLIGERAKEKGVTQVVFDRNGFLYHGRIKAVSEGARKSGLDF